VSQDGSDYRHGVRHPGRRTVSKLVQPVTEPVQEVFAILWRSSPAGRKIVPTLDCSGKRNDDVISSQQLGERLADARKRAKLTQAQVAERVGVARTTLVAMEKGERRPSNTELVKLAGLLATEVHDLLREGYVPTEISPRFRLAVGDRADATVIEAIDRLSELGRRYVELERLHGLRRTPAPLETLQT
jgi:transcriptional regulator with XRE-family HTH domain